MTITITSTIFYRPGSGLIAGQVYQVADIPGKPTYKYLGMFRWSRVNPSAPEPAPYIPNTSAPVVATIDPDTGDVTLTSNGVAISSSGAGGVQVPSDWSASTGVARILNKPTIPTQYTDALAKDAVAAAFAAGTHSGFTITYDSTAKKFNCTASDGGGGGATNLGNTPSATNVALTSSSGTGTTIAAATTSAAGVMSAADKTKLDGLGGGGGVTNLTTTTSATTLTVVSDTGTDAVLPAATTSVAGVMTAADKTKLNSLSVSAGTGAPIYKKLTVTANSQTASVLLVGHGSSTDLDLATAGVSATGDVITISSVPSTFKLTSVSSTTPAGFNTGTSFSLVFPDPFGVASLDDGHLVTLMHYNTAVPSIEQAQTNIGVNLVSGTYTVIKTGLTSGAAARWKASIV